MLVEKIVAELKRLEIAGDVMSDDLDFHYMQTDGELLDNTTQIGDTISGHVWSRDVWTPVWKN